MDICLSAYIFGIPKRNCGGQDRAPEVTALENQPAVEWWVLDVQLTDSVTLGTLSDLRRLVFSSTKWGQYQD